MKQVIHSTGSSRVPVLLSIDKKTLNHEEIDNFDHNKATSSEIERSHDTILMLFKNHNKNKDSPKAFSQKSSGSPKSW